MAQSDFDLQIRDRIDSFVEELTSLVRRSAMDSVREALGGDVGATRPVRSGRPRTTRMIRPTAAKGGRRDRRSLDDIAKLADRLHTHIKAHPGQGMEQISRALRIDTKTLRLPVRKLIALKMIKFAGQKRATKYTAA